MNVSSSPTAAAYEALNRLTLSSEANLAIPTEIGAFAAEVAADTLVLADAEVVRKSAELDAELLAEGKESGLMREYEYSRRYPPSALSENSQLTETWALHRLRAVLASTVFEREFTSRFPERPMQSSDKRFTNEFLQGKLLAARVLQECITSTQPINIPGEVPQA